MDLEFFFPDRVTLRLSDGSQRENVHAQFTKKGTILLPVEDLPVREGDTVFRRLPNGIVDEFDILHVDFQHGHGDLPPVTRLTAKKRGSRLGEHQSRVQNVYNPVLTM